MKLLERDPFQEKLLGWLREAASGEGRLVLLAGEAGVGKTVFVQEFCKTVGNEAKVLLGACDPLSTPRPLGPLLDIASSLGGEFENLLNADRRDVMFHRLLAHLSRPHVLVFEDVHWADEATLDLLRFLGRRIDKTHTLLIATYRNDEVGAKHPFRIVTGDLATAGSVRRLTLPALSEHSVKRLAEGTDIDPAMLHKQTGGNAFFVTEVLASGMQGIPATVRDAVLARAARLSSEARAVIETVAVVGPRAELWLLRDLLASGLQALDECVGVGMLQPQDDSVAFRHELARQAILEAVPPQQRLHLHSRVLQALRAAPVNLVEVASLAHHAEEAKDAKAVLQYAPTAARQAVELKAHREAAAQYARALRFASELSPRERAILLEERAYECYLTDQIQQAIEARQEALEIWRKCDDPLKQGENLRWLSRLSWFLGRHARAEEMAQAALEVLERQPPGLQLAMAYSNQAQLSMLAQDNEAAITWGEKAIALALQLGHSATLVHAQNNVGTARLFSGDEQGWELLEQSLSGARAANLEEHVARAFTNLASAAVSFRQFPRADKYLDEGIAYCIEHDLDSWRLYMSGWHAESLFAQGRWHEAAEAASAVLSRSDTSPISRIQALVVLGLLRARRGDPEVTTVLDEALRLAVQANELQRLGPVSVARAEVAWLRGSPEQIVAETQQAYSMALERRDAWLAAALAYWRWRATALDDAPEWIARPYALEIAGCWREAAAEWQRLGSPYETARALAESSDEAALRQALKIFERLGARPAATATAKQLRELGAKGVPRGPRGSTRANPAQLTAREVEILGLLHEGLQNAEIARKLHLSSKTVGHHVSSILSKLGVRSRMEAVREATSLALIQAGKSEGAN